MNELVNGGFRRRDRHINIISIGTVMLYFAAFLSQWISFDRGGMILANIVFPMIAFATGVTLFRVASLQSIELKLCGLFVLWFAITRIFQGDLYLNEGRYRLAILFGSMVFLMSAYMSMDAEDQSRCTKLVLTGLLAFLLLFAWVSIFAVITNTQVLLPFAQSTIGINDEMRLEIIDRHPNLVGCVYSVSILVMLYLYSISRRKKLAGLLGAIVIISFYAIVALTVSRTAMLNLVIFLGLFAFIITSKKCRLKSGIANKIIAVLLAILVCGLAYLGLDVVRSTMQKLSSDHTSSVAAANIQTVQSGSLLSATDTPVQSGEGLNTPAQSAVPVATPAVIAERSLTDNATTLNGRTDIYLATLRGMLDHPQTFLFGAADEETMQHTNVYLSSPVYHTHNALLQVLANTGVIGLLLIIGFCYTLIRSAVALLKSGAATMSDKVSLLIPAMLLTHSMLEPFVFMCYDITNAVFFLFASIITARAAAVRLVKPL